MEEKITEWDSEDFDDFQYEIPDRSFITKVDGKTLRGNVKEVVIDCDVDYHDFYPGNISYQNYTVTIQLASDAKGSYMFEHRDSRYLDKQEAKTLYEIAEPMGKPWREVGPKKCERYLRLAEYNRKNK